MNGDEPGPSENRQLDFLLADFSAMKAEIARRSGLQRVAVGLYLALVAAVVASLAEGKDLSLPVTATALWVAGLIALLFWCREDLEIARLGRLICCRIGLQASEILDVPVENIVPSEGPVADEGIKRINQATRRYHSWFMWLVFVAIPLLVMLHMWNGRTPYLALIALAAGISVVAIMLVHPRRH